MLDATATDAIDGFTGSPNSNSPGVGAEYTDITSEFLAATKELDVGQVVLHKGHTLADAMSAIEMMDPHMDSGMKRLDPDLGLINALNNMVINEKVSLNDMVAITDATLASIATWLRDAQSLDQTVYLNIWLHNTSPEVITDHIFRALCVSCVNLVQMIRFAVNVSASYVEEDFSPHVNFDIPPLTYYEVQEILKKAEETVVAKTKGKFNKTEYMALLQRIRFFQNFFSAFDAMIPPVDASAEGQSFAPMLIPARLTLKMATAAWRGCFDSIHVGTQPPEKNQPDGDYSWLPCFQPEVNRHLLPPTFPRNFRMASRAEGYKFLGEILHNLTQMIDIAPDVEELPSVSPLLDYLENFMEVDVLSRSCLQLLVLPTDDKVFGVRPMADIIKVSFTEFTPAYEVDKIEQYICTISDEEKVEFDDFIVSAVRVFLNILQTFGNNKMRMRNKSIPGMMSLIRGLSYSAHQLEYRLQSILGRGLAENMFTDFCEFYGTRFAKMYMDMSFDQDLFLPYELPYIFWFYSDFLMRKMVDFGSLRLRSALADVAKTPQRSPMYKRVKAREVWSRSQLYRHALEYDLFTGYFLLFSALADDGWIDIPPNEKLRFDARMDQMYDSPGLRRPSVLGYGRYWNYYTVARQRETDPACQMESWSTRCRYAHAVEFFKQALIHYQNVRIQDDALKMCIVSSRIASSMLADGIPKDKKVTVNLSLSRRYPTIAIQ